MTGREYWMWMAGIPWLYYEKIKKLIGIFGSVEKIYHVDEKELAVRAGWNPEEIKGLNDSKQSFDPKKYLKMLREKKIGFVCVEDENYPEKLRLYGHKPYFLFYKGKLPDKNIPAVALVGARACSGYGRNMARNLGRELSERGVQVISGMARGIDTYSGIGALEGNTPAFAVAGCGADICYPSENIELYDNILKTGGIISEYPPGSPPVSWHFPQRNRIISGLADKVVVVEAKEKSGSLITVEWALEQGKDIMAVPGRAGDRLSSGCNRLIKTGAGMVTCAKDILEELEYHAWNHGDKKMNQEKILEKDFLLLYSELGLQPKNIYELMEATGLEYERLMEMLLHLQLRGVIEQSSDNYYSRRDVCIEKGDVYGKVSCDCGITGKGKDNQEIFGEKL